MDKPFIKNLLVLTTTLLLLGASLPSFAGGTQRISVDSSGVEGNNASYASSLSADSRFVAFESNASNLVIGDTNGVTDIFVHDRTTGVTSRVSVSSDGSQGNAGSYSEVNTYASSSHNAPSLSADGRYVIFESLASNLVTGDNNDMRDIFMHDRTAGITTRVSINTDGTEGNNISFFPTLSADGRYVAFKSDATNLVTSDTNDITDIFVHDRNTGITTRVSINTDGTEGNNTSSSPSISADGRYIAFESDANNLVAGDSNNVTDIFIHDQNTNITSRINSNEDGSQNNNSSSSPSLSADGRYIAFIDNGEISVHDLSTNITNRANHNCVSSYEDCKYDSVMRLSLSADGRYITFTALGSYFQYFGHGPGTRYKINSSYLHDLHSGNTTYISDGRGSSGFLFPPKTTHAPLSLSANGQLVAFSSKSTTLVVNDNNATRDIFVSTNPLSRTRNDFDDDGKADILWRHATIGLNVVYLMNGGSIDSNGPINAVNDPNWQIKGSGDFDRDGKADILWRNTATGLNYLYRMDGSSIKSHSPINIVVGSEWQIKGVDDFDGDGRADILWRNTATGLNYLYLMDGSFILHHAPINTVSDLAWYIESVGDFNGDGKADILWRHAITGLNVIYFMNGTSIISNAEINTIADLNWQVKGVADFNDDGKADILWRHAITGLNVIYFMNGASITSNAEINTIADLNWQIKDTADFDGDGKADILWRHATSGLNYLYFMNGSSITSHGAINSVPDSDWQIQ